MIEPSVKKPSLFRRSVMKLVSGWRRVMDVRYNPLKHIPDPKSTDLLYVGVIRYMECFLWILGSKLSRVF